MDMNIVEGIEKFRVVLLKFCSATDMFQVYVQGSRVRNATFVCVKLGEDQL